jgi:hypothetical protein
MGLLYLFIPLQSKKGIVFMMKGHAALERNLKFDK